MTQIRQISVADTPEFVFLYQSIFPEKNITKEKVQTIFKNEPVTIFVAETAGQVMGFIYFLTVLDEIEIMDVGVHANFRNQGVGGKLLYHAIGQAQKKDIKKIFLEVRADNLPAIHLYLKLGFSFLHSRPNYYADGCEAKVYCKMVGTRPFF